MDFQKLMDAVMERNRQERSRYHVTLGKLASFMAANKDADEVRFSDGSYPGKARSYRGYYSDLAFEPSNEPVSGKIFAKAVKAALGRTFEGYKGGDFTMEETTPLWSAYYGSCGLAIVGVERDGGAVILEVKDLDE